MRHELSAPLKAGPGIFASLVPADRYELDMMSRMRRAAPGATFFQAGAASGPVYVIESGHVKIGFTSRMGREITIDYLKPGELFGAIGLGGVFAHQYFAVAWDEVTVRELARHDYESFVTSRPLLVCELNRVLDQRFARFQRRLQQLLFLEMRERILEVLGDLAHDYGQVVPEGMRVGLRLTHQDIACMIGATREATSQVLGQLKRAGMVVFDRKHPVLLTQAVAPIEVSSGRVASVAAAVS